MLDCIPYAQPTVFHFPCHRQCNLQRCYIAVQCIIIRICVLSFWEVLLLLLLLLFFLTSFGCVNGLFQFGRPCSDDDRDSDSFSTLLFLLLLYCNDCINGITVMGLVKYRNNYTDSKTMIQINWKTLSFTYFISHVRLLGLYLCVAVVVLLHSPICIKVSSAIGDFFTFHTDNIIISLFFFKIQQWEQTSGWETCSCFYILSLFFFHLCSIGSHYRMCVKTFSTPLKQ